MSAEPAAVSPEKSAVTAVTGASGVPAASTKPSFAHLHVHTEYSMLDGAARIDELLKSAAEMGMPAIATTDHGYVFGAYEFWSKARTYGIKPIIGVEAYLTPGTHRRDKTRVRWGDETAGRDDVSGGGAYTHMTLLARTTGGMHNLFRMSSLASMEGHYFKPRIDRELLSLYSDGLIATTGCVGGEIQTRLRLGQYDEARKAAGEFQDLFGKENFFAEVMDHGIPIERQTQRELLRLAKDLAIPLVATNDLHYTKAEAAKAHAALLCVQSGSTLMDPNRFKFDAEEFYLKTPEQMRHLFRELPEACDNTLLIAERCDVSFVEGEGRYMPRFPCPEGENEESWFVKEVERGLEVRYPEGVPAYATERARYETDVILKKGYGGYFLVVADFINWAKDHGIRVGPGRGSGAGSMCAYAMRITDLDPVVHDLVFERFLNPERPSMPDFDVDFDERRRGEVIRYVTEKYGEERVAQIVTYGTIKAKQAVKDAARVMGHPYAMGEKLTKAMPPPIMGKDMPLSGVFDKDHPRYHEATEFRGVHDEDPQAKEVVETALGLEGLKRQWGVHAAGVIMSSEPLIDLIPIMRREQDGQIITQFDYPSCETLGLVKMDFLGLRNLTILDDAIANVRANRGEDVDLEALSKDMTDPKAYEVLAKGDTLGVFQLDGGGTRTLLRQMQPTTFEDISATIALYRPGPMGINSHTNYAMRKTGRQPATPIHPELAEPLEEILGATHNLIVYQEHVIQIAQKVAGYTLGRADLLRKAMGKKKKEVLDAEFAGFEAGMQANGYSANAIKTLVGRADALRGLRLQQGARQGLRADLLLDRLPQGELPRRVHGRAADQRARRQGQVGALPQRVPPDGDQGPAARRQRVGRQLRRRRHRHPVRDGRDPQRRYQRRRRRGPQPRGEGPVCVLQGLPAQDPRGGLQQAHDRVPGQGRSVRQPRPLAPGHRREARPVRGRPGRCQAPGRLRAGQPVRRADVRSLRPRRGRGLRRPPGAAHRTSGTSRRCSPSSGRCSGSTSPTTRCSASSTSSPSTPTPRSPPSWATSRSRTAPRSSSPGSSPVCRSSARRRATSGRSPRSRTSRAPSSACSSPARMRRSPPCCAPTSSASCGAGCPAATTRSRSTRRSSPSRTSRRAPVAPSW